MEAKNAIRKRRCVKKYLDKPVSTKTILEILDCARWAHTALGAQSWEFVLVREQAIKVKLAEAAKQEWISSAPVIIVFCTNLERIEYTLKKPPWDFAIMEIAAAVQNAQVAARSLGLGSCAAFMFNREKVKEIICAPEKIVPLAIVPLGYPKEFPENKRAPLKDFLHKNKVGNPMKDLPDKYNKKWQRSSIIHLLS